MQNEKVPAAMQDNVTQAAENTDREIWREREGDYYADSIHVTQQGSIGIDCGGHVIQMPVRYWHRLASTTAQTEAVQKLKKQLAEAEENINLKADFIDATINGLAMRDEAMQKLVEALEEISDLHGEINPSNYDHDDACELNRQFCYAVTTAAAALAAYRESQL